MGVHIFKVPNYSMAVFFLYRKTAVIYRTTIYDSPILEQKIKDSMNQIVIINCQRTDL